MPTFTSPLNFMGVGTDLPATGNNGDLYVVNGDVYVYVDRSGWEQLTSTPEIPPLFESNFDGSYLIFDI